MRKPGPLPIRLTAISTHNPDPISSRPPCHDRHSLILPGSRLYPLSHLNTLSGIQLYSMSDIHPQPLLHLRPTLAKLVVGGVCHRERPRGGDPHRAALRSDASPTVWGWSACAAGPGFALLEPGMPRQEKKEADLQLRDDSRNHASAGNHSGLAFLHTSLLTTSFCVTPCPLSSICCNMPFAP